MTVTGKGEVAGQRVGRFRIERLIGSGGMGTVYEATDVFLGRPVALKVLTPLTEAFDEARERFFREARAVARLEHPNIVRIYEAESSPESPYIAMELIRGGDLKQMLSGAPPPARDRLLEVAAQVFEGLGHAHAHGVIHRDVKPANVLLTPEGTVKLIDFGLARLHDDERDLTRGQVFGSASFMAPEQIMDPRTIDYRADIYSAGVLLHQLVTGRVPHQAATVAETLVKVVHSDIPDPRLIVPDLEPPLAELILRCLARDRDDRPTSAADVARELREIARGGPVTASATVSSLRLPAPTTILPVDRTSGTTGSPASADRDEPPEPRWRPDDEPWSGRPGGTARDVTEGDRTDSPPGLDTFDFTTTAAETPDPPTFLPPPVSARSRRAVAAAAGVALGLIVASATAFFILRRPRPPASSFQLPPLPSPASVEAPDERPVAPPVRPDSSSSVRLVALSPDPSRGLRLDARLGQTVDFRVRVEGTSRSPRWLLNDDPVAEGTSYAYRPLRATRDLVSVIVTEGNSTATLSWYVTVK